MLRAALIALAVTTTPLAAQAQRPPPSAVAPEFRLKGDVVSLPFVMVREFPFVEAEVNGVKGKLMLDTGAADALALNHNPIKFSEGEKAGEGRFGSGQRFEIFMRPRVESVRLPGGLTYGPVTTVQSQDAAQLERITPDFIGWLGYYFWDGYAVKFDYKASRVTFYKKGPKAFLKGEKVIAAIPFETRSTRLPNHPVMVTKIGGVDFETAFDTGQYGNLYVDDATRAKLTEAGVLKPVAGEDNPADITGVRFSTGTTVNLPHFAVHSPEGAEPFAKAIGLTQPNVLSMGYGFLNQFKTVWDYPNKTLYLLKR